MTSIRPRRSVLYMPGSNARALEKARSLAADALILDLEDAVAPDAKALARDQVCAAVASRRLRRARARHPHQCPRHALGRGGSRRGRRGGARCDPGAEGVVARNPRRRRPAPAPPRRPGAHPRLGDDRDAARDPARRGDRQRRPRRRHAPRLLRDGHQRPRQGDPRPPRARPRADAALADDRPRRRPGARTRHRRRGLQRAQGRGGLFGRVPRRDAIAASTARP